MIKKYNLDSSLVNYIDNLGMGVEARGALGGTVYYVEGNAGNDAWDGLSIDKPFKTLAKAIAVSNIDINRRARWAKRNTIYVFADTLTENLVAFPNKCDIVGCGSYDANTQAGLVGNHVPVNSGNYGTRFLNMWLKGAAAAGPLFTLANTTSGLQLLGNTLSAPVSGTTNTIGVKATASPFLKIIGNRFEGPFSTSYITFGAGEAGGTEILRNRMTDGAASGIVVNASTKTAWGSFIAGNMIKAAGVTINDPSNLFHVIDNDLISLATVTGYETPAEALVCNAALASRNYLTAANVNFAYPIADTTT
jgi:hypothetical protein